MTKKEKLKEYKKSLGLIALGIIVCIPTGYFVADGVDIDLGRGASSTSSVFLVGFLSIGWGLLKAFLTALAFSNNDEA